MMKSAAAKNRQDIISICALVPYPAGTAPSQRYRIEQWLPHLQSAGISVDLLPFADDKLMQFLHKPGGRLAKAAATARGSVRRFAELTRVLQYDAVLIHRTACLAGPALLERLIALCGRPVIYDFDDAIFELHTTEANRGFGWLKFPGKTATICRISDHVVVANQYLASYARRYNPQVTVIPSSVDVERYRPSHNGRGSSSRIVIGWMGSSTSQTHLELFAPVLQRLVASNDVELRVVSDREPVLPGVRFVWHSWSANTEIEELSEFDIGVMPMPDDAFARGKSAMKALLYMSMGVPTICSPVGANKDVIQHEENGLLAATAEEWVLNLQRLVDDAGLRKRLGAMGRRTVEERYSMRGCAELFARVVRETVGERTAPSGAERGQSVDSTLEVSRERQSYSKRVVRRNGFNA